MMQTDEIQQELLKIFHSELEDHLRTISRCVLALEQNPTPEDQAGILYELYRAAHSLKGSSRIVGLTVIESIAHRLEDALEVVRQGQQELPPAFFDALLAATDAIRDELTADLRGAHLPDNRLNALFTQLESVTQTGDQPSAATAKATPASAASSSTAGSVGSGLPASTPTLVPMTLPPPAPPAATAMRPVATDDTIRVATAKLDALMDSLGELLVARMRTEQLLEQVKGMQQHAARWQKTWRRARPLHRRLQRHAQPSDDHMGPLLVDFLAQNEIDLKKLNHDLSTLASRLANDRNHLQLVTDDLQNGIRKARMLPIATLFDIFPRMARDLARERGKEINLVLEGTETEVDRQALELMKDPLTHLLRNAVDHGLEPPGQRAAEGKSRAGTIHLRAEQRGNNLVLEVSDDGRGIDLEAVRQTALDRGLISSAEAASQTESDTLELIFRAGFSTAQQVTDISGRGVGMDVVRQNLEQLHGLIQVNTWPRQGTTFTLTLPLTLATSHVLLVRAAQETLALPMLNVERILRVGVDRIGSIEGRPAIFAEGSVLPLFNLAQTLKLPAAETAPAPGSKISVVVVSAVEKRVALQVDGFLATQEVVIKNLGRQLRRVRNVAGATLLGDGRLVMILNLADLMKTIQGTPSTATAIVLPLAIHAARKPKVLVADDSITTRTLEKHILENAGYEVLVAADGQEAWEIISRREEADWPDLIVSDINMPNMDGFALTEAIKADRRTARLPVVLVTSLDSPQDKLRGLEAGAEAYLVKSSFDQHALLEAIERLVG
jgi:two-component system, chemotaxis family, sensor kinase CheA